MAKLTIDTGAAGNPATGDTLRTAMTKVNANFTEIYNELGSDGTFSNISFDGNTISTDDTNGNLIIDPNGTGNLVIDATIINTATNSNIKISPNGTGALDVDTSRIINVTDPTSAQDAATKNYVDTQLSSSDHNFTFVGDDSTGTAVTQGETFKFAGTQNITTAVSGDTLTITGPDLSSYATTSYVDAQNQSQALTFVGDDSTGTAVNSGETFKIAGTQNITTAVSGDTLTVTGPDLSTYVETNDSPSFGTITLTGDITGNGTASLDITGADQGSTTAGQSITIIAGDNTGGSLFDSGNAGTVTITGGNSNFNPGGAVTINAGTGSINGSVNLGSANTTDVRIKGLIYPTADGSANTVIKTNGSGTLSFGSVAFSEITSTPTTLSGYGITDAASSTTTAMTVVGDDSTGTAITLGETFKIAGTQNVTTAVSSDTLTITGPDLTNYLQNTGTQTIDNLSFNDNIISTSSNADLILQPGGTGQVVTNSALKINKGYIEAINSLTSSSTITVDFAEASVHTVTLAENTQFVVTNLPTGATGTIIITQDGGGSNTGSFGTDGSTAVKFAGGTPTLSTAGNAIDVVTIFNDGTNYLGNIAKAYAA